MVKGKAIPSVVHWIIIRLSTSMNEEEIAMYTDVSTRSVRKILTNFKSTGSIVVPDGERLRVHRALCNYDVEVCFPSSMPRFFDILAPPVHVPKAE